MLLGAVMGVADLRGQEIEESRPVVRELRFEGNRAIDDETLATSIATTASSCGMLGLGCAIGLGEERYFNEREFRRDVLRLRALYTQSGFRQVQVDTVVVRSDGNVRVRFRIHEGEPVRVTSLEITGVDGIVRPRTLRRDLPLQVGDPFNRFRLQASADAILLALQNRGYPFPQVFRNFDEDRDRLEAQVSFDVDPGPRAVVSDVVVTGARQVDESTIRRMIPVTAGEVYRHQQLVESQRALYAMDVFSYVNVRLRDTVPAGDGDSTVTVEVQVSEGSLRRVRFGAGYGSIDCLRGLAGWTSRNFLGGTRRLDVTARISKIGAGAPADLGFQNDVCFGLRDEDDPERLKMNYTLSVSLREPFLFSRRTSATISFTAERRSEILAYLREAVGGDVAVSRLVRGVPLTLTYALTYGRTVAPPAVFCSFLNVCREQDTRVFTERRVQSTLSLRGVRDRRNVPLDPTSGSFVTGEVRWASDLIGSDSLVQFTRAVGEMAVYHRLSRRGVLGWRIRGGTIVPPTLRFAGQSLQFVPPDERFYGGGPNSVRGFGQNQLGPVVRVLDPTRGDSVDTNDDGEFDRLEPDTLVSPTGGNQLLVTNVELRFPLPLFGGRLGGALFLDAGQVVRAGDNFFDFSNLRFTPGVGTRFASPLGPIRFDIAYNGYRPEAGPLFRREGETLVEVDADFQPQRGSGLFSRLRFHFSVGQAF